MKSEIGIFSGAMILTVIVAFLIGSGASGVGVIFLAILSTLIFAAIGYAMRRPEDAHWLPRWIFLGFLAKLGGTFARFWMVTVFYNSGDSYRYYSAGTEFAIQWRAGTVPELSGRGGFGTQIVEWVTGALFAVVTPDMLGGFLVFAILAFSGQLLLYAAFRRYAAGSQLKPFAILILLLPTYAFWPSSIGKDALVLLGLGASAYCVARALEAFEIRWLLALGVALVAVGAIRIHIAGLVVGAFIAAALFAKVPSRGDPAIGVRRLIVLLGGLGIAAVVLAVFPDIFGVDLLDSQDRDGFTASVASRTTQGSVASGEPASSPLDLPGAIAHVLFRPWVGEAGEIQHYLASAETTVLALLGIWKLPAILGRLGRWRSNPYVVFSTFYTIGFAIAFTAIRNLGIIARQRGQVLAFFLCFVIALGWEPNDSETEVTDEKVPLPVSSYPQRR